MHTILLVEDERTLRELVGDYLTRRSGGQWRVLRREDLLLRLWGWDYEGSDRVVDTHVKNLRRALGPWARCLKTVFKTGYKWEEE